MPGRHQGSGLTDKLYWRLKGGYHCFKRAAWGRRLYAALCDDDITITGSGGGSIRRPPPVARCARCDCAEMKRRGWNESGPTSKDWDEY